MKTRPGRPPAAPRPESTITLKISGDVKARLIEASQALDISIAEYVSALVRRDIEV